MQRCKYLPLLYSQFCGSTHSVRWALLPIWLAASSPSSEVIVHGATPAMPREGVSLSTASGGVQAAVRPKRQRLKRHATALRVFRMLPSGVRPWWLRDGAKVAPLAERNDVQARANVKAKWQRGLQS